MKYKRNAEKRQKCRDAKFEKLQAEFAKNGHQIEKADSFSLWHPKNACACVKCRQNVSRLKEEKKKTRSYPPCTGWLDYETTRNLPRRITWHRWTTQGVGVLEDVATFFRMTDAEVQSRHKEADELNRDLLEREKIRSAGGKPKRHLPGIQEGATARYKAKLPTCGRRGGRAPRLGKKRSEMPKKEVKRKIKKVRNAPKSPESRKLWRREVKRKRSWSTGDWMESEEAWKARVLASGGRNRGWTPAEEAPGAQKKPTVATEKQKKEAEEERKEIARREKKGWGGRPPKKSA